MSDQPIFHNEAGIINAEPVFTQEQVEKIIAEVTKRVRETQVEEAYRRQEGSDLPEEISEELGDYSSSELQRALQRFKRSIHKYNYSE
jgi:hypothetical protein